MLASENVCVSASNDGNDYLMREQAGKWQLSGPLLAFFSGSRKFWPGRGADEEKAGRMPAATER